MSEGTCSFKSEARHVAGKCNENYTIPQSHKIKPEKVIINKYIKSSRCREAQISCGLSSAHTGERSPDSTSHIFGTRQAEVRA